MEAVNLKEKLALFDETWVPKIVGELNGQHVKLAKFEGAYVWHSHETEDEMFLCLAGRMDIEMRDRTVTLGEGEFFIVPRGVEHRPVGHGMVHAMLFEPATVRNTGDVEDERTLEPDELDRI